MKTLKILLLVILFATANFTIAQIDEDKKEFRDNIENIMKQKIIENLNIDESTADKFVTAYKQNAEEVRKLDMENRELLKSIEQDPDASDIDTKLDKILDIDSKKNEQRKIFFNELRTFLTPQQIAKTMILRMKFRKNLKQEILKQRKRGMK